VQFAEIDGKPGFFEKYNKHIDKSAHKVIYLLSVRFLAFILVRIQ